MRKFKYIFDIRVMIGIVAILSFSLYIFSGATLNFYQNPSKEIVVIGNYQFSRYPIVELEDRSKNISLEVRVYAKLLEDKTLYVLGERAVYIIDVESNKIRMIYNDTPLFDQYISNAQLVSLYGSNIEAVNTLSVNDTLRMYKNDDIRMYNFNCITDTIVEVITTCNTYTLLTVHLL